MNKQKKDGNISWTDYTWNPVRGLCPVGCKYCYARAMYKRFKLDPEIRPASGNFEHLRKFKKLEAGTKIFVCSTIEIFHPEIKPMWRSLIFKIIRESPHLIFQILTKMPENIDRPMPDNVWLGVSVTGEDELIDMWTLDALREAKAKVKFVSYEPMLDWLDTDIFFDWLIIGKLTGFGAKHKPRRHWIDELITKARMKNTAIFLKNNLREIMGGKLIQEFPK